MELHGRSWNFMDFPYIYCFTTGFMLAEKKHLAMLPLAFQAISEVGTISWPSRMCLVPPNEDGFVYPNRNRNVNDFKKKEAGISMVSINNDRDFEVLIISISHQKTGFQWFQSRETGTSMISTDRK